MLKIIWGWKMTTAEYSRQYRIDNPDKYKIWDKQKREKHRLRMLTDEEYANTYREKRRGYENDRIKKIRRDPTRCNDFRMRHNRAMLKWYHSKKQLERILNNMKNIKVEVVEKTILTKINKPIVIIKSKQIAYREMYLKICDLERLITIDSVREPKIKELKEQFYEQYGDYGED